MSSASELLAQIDSLTSTQDAAGLVALEDHEDKKVRKAARKALHVLRARGVEIPRKEAVISWSAGGLDALRGDLEDRAMIDTRSMPGATRWILSQAEPESGASLMIALVGPDGRMLDFSAGYQTDGQRARMLKEWGRTFEGRTVPVDFVRAQLATARRRTHELGYSLPASFNEMQDRLGELPEQVAADFLDGALGVGEESPDLDALIAAGVPQWPMLMDAADLIPRLNEAAKGRADDGAEGDSQTPLSEEDRQSMYRAALEGDEKVREGLRGPVARALTDAAVATWIEGRGTQSRRLRGMVSELSTTEACEQIPWAIELVQMQVSALAVQQMQRMTPPGS